MATPRSTETSRSLLYYNFSNFPEFVDICFIFFGRVIAPNNFTDSFRAARGFIFVFPHDGSRGERDNEC